jgi:hypothetical protein
MLTLLVEKGRKVPMILCGVPQLTPGLIPLCAYFTLIRNAHQNYQKLISELLPSSSTGPLKPDDMETMSITEVSLPLESSQEMALDATKLSDDPMVIDSLDIRTTE